MNELTASLPKPLLEVHGKTLLEHKFEALPEEVSEIVLIVGYMGGMIQQKFGGTYKDKRILYIEQDVLDGTAGALWRAKDILTDRFLVMMGDDLYSLDDAKACIGVKDWTLLVQETEHMEAGGCIIVDAGGNITAIEEGKHGGKAGLVSTNMFVLDTRLFSYPLIPKAEGSDEYGLPQTVLEASKTGGIPFSFVKATEWIQVTSPEDIQKAEAILE